MKKIVSYILLIVWLLVIFYLSNQSGNISGSISSGIIYKTFHFIYDLFNLNTNNLENIVTLIHNPIRELMHLLEYLILGILLINVLKQNTIRMNIVLASIVFCFIYAITDEIHQLFVPGRTFEFFDIFMDTVGAVIGSKFANKVII